MSIQRGLMGLVGVLHRLPGMFAASLVVFFSVMSGGGPVRMGGLLVKFRRSLMGIVRHDDPFCYSLSGAAIF